MTADQGEDLLSTAHRAELEEGSGLPPEIIKERGCVSVAVKAELKRKGFGAGRLNVPALLIPIRDVRGNIGGCQCKPDEPRVCMGRRGGRDSLAGESWIRSRGWRPWPLGGSTPVVAQTWFPFNERRVLPNQLGEGVARLDIPGHVDEAGAGQRKP